jgi:COMPASS component SWD2
MVTLLQLFRNPVPEKQDKPITSLDFDDKGELLVTAGADETLQLYNCLEGKYVTTVNSQKYGAHLARFTHQSNSVVYASTKDNGMI